MSGPATGAVIPIRFEKNLSLLSGAGSAGIALNATGEVLEALRGDKPLPTVEIELGRIHVEAETPKPIEFGNGSAKVSFTAKGGAFAGIGVFQDPARAVAAISPGEEILPGVDFGSGADRNFVLLRWGYDVKANTSGNMALGPAASASLAVEGASEGLFAVVRSLDRNMSARKTLQSAVDSWMLPRQVRDAAQLDPGTWLISEIQASVGVSVGIQAGYKFNWVREAKLNKLQGDIGLRIDAAIAAKVGFRAEGRWAVVVAREDETPVLRVRLFRLKSHQLNLAVNASAVFKPVTTILPDRVDDVVKAVFGTHGSQVLGYIAVVEKWTDKNTKLTDLLAAEGVDQAKNLIAHVANVPADQLDDKFEEVRGSAVKLIQTWRDLDHRVATTILKFADEKVDLTEVRAILGKLATINEQDVRDLLVDRLGAADFLNTPAGKLLESMAAGKGVLSLLNTPIQKVNDVAGKALKVLDGSAVEGALGRFQEFLEKQFNIGVVLNTITETDFNKLDGLLKQKMADFLGETGIDFSRLEEIRGAIRMVLAKRQEWYGAALRVLRRQYNAELAASYQKTVKNTAHFDVRLDFRHDPQGVSQLLEAALSGDFDTVLTARHPDVKFGLAKLSHGVERRAHVELTLPFFQFEGTHLNQALATVEAASDSGRVLVYTLTARDTVSSNTRNSTLAVAMSLESELSQLRVHEGSGFDYNYTLRQAGERVKPRELEAQLNPMFEVLKDMPPVRVFVDYFGRRTEEVTPGTPDILGNLFTELQVNFSAANARVIGDAWMRARLDKVAAYEPMSLAIQMALRRVITDSYFQDGSRYENFQTAQTLLCWASICPANELLADGTRPHKPREVIWDVASVDLRRLRLNENQTGLFLQNRLESIHMRLKDMGMKSLADRYHPDEQGKIRKRFIDDPRQPHFDGLLLGEGRIVDEVWEAAKAMSEFVASRADKPSLAIKRLQEFGAKLTTAFNSTVGGVFLNGVSRALGTLVFIEATKALAGAPIDLRQNATLSISAMKNGFAFDSKKFLETGEIPGDQVAVREQLVAIT